VSFEDGVVTRKNAIRRMLPFQELFIFLLSQKVDLFC
jgi:hypothetical protein